MAEETIIAQATPPGRGGIGIIRISGSLAYPLALELTHQKEITPREVLYSEFFDKNGEILDKGILIYFAAPHSFTGEDVVEFQLHGSPVILDVLIKECTAKGARIARPGEFSERAFLNGKLDLTQAEAIADLINASSLSAARMAMRSLKGEFSKKINELDEKLVHLRLFIEAALDFPEEEIDFLKNGHVLEQLNELLATLTEIQKNAKQSTMMQEGVSLVIAGKPNVGKSTLINHLAGQEVAIVTDIAGTTRDVMRAHILLDDLPLHIIDTAGLRESTDLVEQEGIRRAWKEIEQADCIIFLKAIDDNEEDVDLKEAIVKHCAPNIPILYVFNKIDLNQEIIKYEGALYLSAKTGEGLALLKSRMKQAVGYQIIEGQFLARRRHLEVLEKVMVLLLEGHYQLTTHGAGELLAENLRLGHHVLGEITGEFSSDDLLGKIFSTFCIGK